MPFAIKANMPGLRELVSRLCALEREYSANGCDLRAAFRPRLWERCGLNRRYSFNKLADLVEPSSSLFRGVLFLAYVPICSLKNDLDCESDLRCFLECSALITECKNQLSCCRQDHMSHF